MLLEYRFINAKNWIISNFGEINSSEICYSGINSEVWRINLREYSFALKLLKIKNNNEIYKYEREIKFISYLNKRNINCVPKLIGHNKIHLWILFEWIEGEKQKIFDEELIQVIINFLSDINKEDSIAKEFNIGKASEACLNSNDFAKFIDRRLFILKNKSKSNIPLSEIYRKILKKEIYDFNRKTKPYLLSSKINDFISKNGKILTQSDIGIHNLIKSSKGYYFIDFEHSGWDSITKTLADIVLQPNHIKFSKDIIDSFRISSDVLKIYEFKSNNWIPILETQRIKWSLIILNSLLNQDKKTFVIEDLFFLEKKLVNYLKITKEIISSLTNF